MNERFDVVVVGAGPAGSVAAWHAAIGGAKVLLLEKDRDIGPPVRCAEGVAADSLKLVVEPDKSFIQNEIEGLRLYAPNGQMVPLISDDRGYILNRKVFDWYLAQLAAKAGADVRTKAYVNGLLFEDGHVAGVTFQSLGKTFRVHSKIVIGADGVESRVGRWAGLRTQLKLKDIETCVQFTLGNIEVDRRYCDFYFSRNLAPGGYVWVFPKGDGTANVGLGISGLEAQKLGRSPISYLRDFVEQKFPGAPVITTTIGGVPVAKTLKRIVTSGLMLVGDAARQVNPVSGGGIVSGMIAGKIAGQIAAEAVRAGDTSDKFLKRYEKEWHKAEGRNHEIFYRVKEAIHRFTDDELNAIASSFLELPEGERTLVNLFKIALKQKPSLILDVFAIFKDQAKSAMRASV